jgi:AMP deaminase
MPEAKGYTIKEDQGIFNLYKPGEDGQETRVPYKYFTLAQYIQDKNAMCSMIADGPL